MTCLQTRVQCWSQFRFSCALWTPDNVSHLLLRAVTLATLKAVCHLHGLDPNIVKVERLLPMDWLLTIVGGFPVLRNVVEPVGVCGKERHDQEARWWEP